MTELDRESDGRPALALPAFVDGHCHLDKTFLGLPWIPHQAQDSVAGRIDAERALRGALPLPTYDRAKALLRKMAAFGTTALRTHVDIDTSRGLDDLHAILRLREETREHVTIQIVAFPQSGILRDPGTRDLLDAALSEGADLVGGLDPATIDGDRAAHLDIVFGLAEKHGKGIDVHLHERHEQGLATIGDMCGRALAAGLQDRVTISHAFALGDADEAALAEATANLARAKISIATSAPGAFPMPPVKPLREAGVLVFAGSDNIRDAWSPLGNGDMLERAMLVAWRQNFRTDADVAIALDLVSCAGRRALGLGNGRLGSEDDKVLLPAETPSDAVARRPVDRMVLHGSKVLAREGVCLAF